MHICTDPFLRTYLVSPRSPVLIQNRHSSPTGSPSDTMQALLSLGFPAETSKAPPAAAAGASSPSLALRARVSRLSYIHYTCTRKC